MQYSEDPDPISNQRDQLICDNLALVRYVVGKMHLDTTGTVFDFVDLLGHGTIGLIQAVDRFDEARGIPFPAFAIPRIRGAVLDAFRSLDPLSRGQRTRATQINLAQNALALRLGREPSESEVRDASGLSPVLFRVTKEIAAISRVPIGDEGDDRGANAGQEPADDQPAPSTWLEQEQVLVALQDAVDALPDRQRMVVSLYYRERLTYREIAGLLKVSESRVSQLMKQALRRMRAHSSLIQATSPLAA